jgi:succinyl-CoA synthetase beta subunit
MDIEEVAHSTPELIHKEEIDPKVGLQGFQARKIAFNLGLSGDAFKDMVNSSLLYIKLMMLPILHSLKLTRY